MDVTTVAVIIQEGSKIIGELIRHGAFHRAEPQEDQPTSPARPQLITTTYKVKEGKATATATGCLPCAIGHLGTCSGLLNEATRFARKDGPGSDEVIDRINMCLDELNSFERVDLRPEMIDGLPDSERELARQALNASRDIRHALENISSSDTLEKAAADIQRVRMRIGREYLKNQMAALSPEKKEEVKREVTKLLSERIKELNSGPEEAKIKEE